MAAFVFAFAHAHAAEAPYPAKPIRIIIATTVGSAG